jgi:aminopeptidase N
VHSFQTAILLAALSLSAALSARVSGQDTSFTRADTLRGSNGPGRAWWDVTFYDLHVRVNPSDSTISGWNRIAYRVNAPGAEMQIDLQQPLQIDSIVQDGGRLEGRRDGNAHFVRLLSEQRQGETRELTVFYRGRPRVATNPPWEGGFIWREDGRGNAWVATANQGLGASAWWPNKDHMSDEPDSQRVAITVPTPMVDVSNGRLREVTVNDDGTTTWAWAVTSPINNYGIAVNAGTYAHWREVYDGESGSLTMDFWPLAENERAARAQWAQVRPMLRCFEDWFGPFPWYEDGYKLIEAPHLGMEHQSAIAYGNGYRNGYRGTDLSGTGRGLTWDFIIVHESAHEWWANNVTASDGADLWVHESFANYAEGLYVECQTGSREAGAEYVIGTRARIVNDRRIVGVHGVNNQGSGDMYYKGGNVLHTIRQLVDDDQRWRDILRGLNATFRRATVDGADVEAYISRESGIDLTELFEQYLRTTMVPTLEYRIRGSTLSFRWTNVVQRFDMPVRVRLAPGGYAWIQPTEAWQDAELRVPTEDFGVDPDFYVIATPIG